MKFFKWIITRLIFTYLVCFLVTWHFLDYRKAKENAIGETMSRFVPGIAYFNDFVDRHDHFDEFKLHQCIAYHRRVVEYFSFQKSEAYQMMGFCYDRLGNLPRAIMSYQAAREANPVYFWPYYNLGIYAYKRKDYSQAVDFFQESLQTDIKMNMVLLLHSKVFTDVRLSDGSSYNVVQGMLNARENSYIFLMESLFKLKKYDQLFKVALLGLKENSESQDIFYSYAGKAAFHQGSYEQALALLQLALQKNPQNTDALLYTGLCFQAAGKEPQAQNLFAMAKQIYQQQGSALEKHLNSTIRFF